MTLFLQSNHVYFHQTSFYYGVKKLSLKAVGQAKSVSVIYIRCNILVHISSKNNLKCCQYVTALMWLLACDIYFVSRCLASLYCSVKWEYFGLKV